LSRGKYTFTALAQKKPGGKFHEIRGTYDFENLAQW
jgi:hypothetical protein